jgi:hypothetical protein
MNIIVEWGTVLRVSAGVIACMVVYYALFYDHGE